MVSGKDGRILDLVTHGLVCVEDKLTVLLSINRISLIKTNTMKTKQGTKFKLDPTAYMASAQFRLDLALFERREIHKRQVSKTNTVLPVRSEQRRK